MEQSKKKISKNEKKAAKEMGKAERWRNKNNMYDKGRENDRVEEDRGDVTGMEATCRDSRRAAAETNKPCFSAARRFELFYALRGVSQPPGLPVLISAAQFVLSPLSFSLSPPVLSVHFLSVPFCCSPFISH